MNYSEYRAIAEISKEFDEFCSWLSENSINYDKTRIHTYKKSLTLVANHFRQADISNAPKIDQELINIFLETDALLSIYRGFKASLNDIIKEKLSEAICGPINYQTENNSSNLSRNTIFELYIAAHLKSPEIDLVLSKQDEDMSFQIDGFKVFVECKRPMVKNRIDKNLKNAISQLNGRYKTSKLPAQSKGILAISITRVQNPDQLVLFAKSEQAIGSRLKQIMESFKKEYEAIWRKETDKFTIGVLVHLSGISMVQNIPYTTNQFMMVYLSNNDRGEDALMERIMKAIEGKSASVTKLG